MLGLDVVHSWRGIRSTSVIFVFWGMAFICDTFRLQSRLRFYFQLSPYHVSIALVILPPSSQVAMGGKLDFLTFVDQSRKWTSNTANTSMALLFILLELSSYACAIGTSVPVASDKSFG